MSATQAVYRALELYAQYAQAVRLDPPERREIESRSGATVPIRDSKGILRAFETMAGGPDAITVDLDPLIAEPMRDVGRGLGYGLSEFAKNVLEDSFANNHMYTCELKPLFFTKAQWERLISMLSRDRVRSAEELLLALSMSLPMEEATSQSIPTPTAG